jgi:hypothetical protein
MADAHAANREQISYKTRQLEWALAWTALEVLTLSVTLFVR